MRQGTARAPIWHARHRQARALGCTLLEQPLMPNVLADLAVEPEARLSRPCGPVHTFDAADDPAEALLARPVLLTVKYSMQAGHLHAAEAMERPWVRATSRRPTCPACSARAPSTASGRSGNDVPSFCPCGR